MKKYLLIALCAGLVFSLGACKDDDNDSDILHGEWLMNTIVLHDFPDRFSLYEDDTLSVGFYGEDSYTLTFMADNQFERIISGIKNSSTSRTLIQDAGNYTESETTLSLNPISGDTQFALHNTFTILTPPSEKDMLLEVPITIRVVPNDVWNDPDLGGAVDSQEKLNQLYAEYGEDISAKAKLAFDRQ